MFQKVTIIGNLGSDPEMRYMQDGTAVTSTGAPDTAVSEDEIPF